MKRKLALLLLLLVAVATIFVACGQTAATKILIRWEDAEQYDFHVSLAAFDPDYGTQKATSLTELFLYNEQNGVKFYKDMAITGEVFSDLDEIRPVAVDGKYHFEISKESGNWKFATEQTLYVQYNKSDIKISEAELKPVEDAEVAANTNLSPSEKTVIFRSVIKTDVTFEDNTTQNPVSSSTDSNGFYIGKSNQQASKYKIETAYDFSGKRPTAKVSVDGKETTYKLGRNATFIDPNQLLLYIRSFDKSSSSFADNPAVNVFNPQTGELVAASFRFVYNEPLVITDSAREQSTKNVSLNAVTVTIGGLAYMMQENIPDYAEISGEILKGENDATDKRKYTTNRFRVGYLAYELEQYDNSVWDALNYKKAD